MPLPEFIHGCIFLTWFICLVLFVFRKNLRLSQTIFGVGLLFVPMWFVRSEFDQLFRIRGRPALTGIYVYNAYRVSNEEIRFFFMKNIDDKQPLQFLEREMWKSVGTTCVCPLSTLISQCTVEAHLGVVRSNESNSLTLRVPGGSVEREIDLIDVRPTSSAPHYRYPHTLGVCVQPIYYHADWTLFIQFFEYWIASGATKFYIYLHSATPQVRRVLHHYSRLLSHRMEIIPWADLPVAAKDRADFSRDPNTRAFRAGAYGAINDCILRARWQVKFLAMLDIDEMLIARPGTSLVKRIEEIADWNPFAATFSLEWNYGIVEDSHTKRARTPRNITFDNLYNVKIVSSENVLFDYSRLRKIIQRPERVTITDIHNTILNENVPPTYDGNDSISLPYYTVFVNGSDLSVLHLRRFKTRRSSSAAEITSVPARLDANMVSKMNSNLRKRTALLDTDMGEWWPVIVERTMSELEACKGHCRSLANCEPTLTSAELFAKEPSLWTNVASRAKFIQYIV